MRWHHTNNNLNFRIYKNYRILKISLVLSVVRWVTVAPNRLQGSSGQLQRVVDISVHIALQVLSLFLVLRWLLEKNLCTLNNKQLCSVFEEVAFIDIWDVPPNHLNRQKTFQRDCVIPDLSNTTWVQRELINQLLGNAYGSHGTKATRRCSEKHSITVEFYIFLW